jgi:hypothetical protein
MLPHLNNGWEVDQAILSEEERVVVIIFYNKIKSSLNFFLKHDKNYIIRL